MMRLLTIACVLLASVASIARAQPAHTTRDAVACVDPRAVRALSDTANPRHADPHWIIEVATNGQCGTLPAGTPVMKVGEEADLSKIVASGAGAAGQLLVRQADLKVTLPAQPDDSHVTQAAPPPPPAVQAAAPTAPWQFSASSEGLYTCQIAGGSAEGHVTLMAAMIRPKVVRLLLQKPAWGLAPGALVHVSLAFPGGNPVEVVGTGDGSEITVDLTELTLPLWVRGFTGAPTGTVTFTTMRNETPWSLDLRGAGPAIAAMAACVREHRIDVPPPLGDLAPPPVSVAPQPPPDGRTYARRNPSPPVPQPAAPPPRRVAAAQPGVSSQPGAPQQSRALDPVSKAYAGCVRTEARSGQYTEGNTDRNALAVLSQCIPEWRAWMEDCRKNARGTDRDCTVDSITLAKMDIFGTKP